MDVRAEPSACATAMNVDAEARMRERATRTLKVYPYLCSQASGVHLTVSCGVDVSASTD